MVKRRLSIVRSSRSFRPGGLTRTPQRIAGSGPLPAAIPGELASRTGQSIIFPVQLSVIIPLFNCLEFSQAMLASLRATLPANLEHEILLVDNGSTDGTRDWLKTVEGGPVRTLLHRANLGYAVANNRAAEQARGLFVALLNNDLVLLPGWLEPMMELAARPATGVVGNIQLSVRSREICHAGVFFDGAGSPVHFQPPLGLLESGVPIKPPAVTGALMLLRRSLFGELRGFDEDYLNGYEDIDLCLRAREMGRQAALATRSAAYHHVGASEGRHAGEMANASRFEVRWGNIARRLALSDPPPAQRDPVGSGQPEPLPFDRDAYASLQAFHPGPGGYSEQNSSAHLYPAGQWATVSVPLPLGLVRNGVALRLDPCNFPATVRIASLNFRESRSHKMVWTVGPAELPQVLEVAGAVESGTGSHSWITLSSEGSDPRLSLRTPSIPAEIAGRTDLVAEIQLQTSPAATRTGGRKDAD